MIDELRISTSDRDICEPLDTRSVCQSLNDSGALCQPSKWAGEAIQEALNATRAAMTSLESTLHFYVSSDPYDRNRNTSGLIFRIRKQVAELNLIFVHSLLISSDLISSHRIPESGVTRDVNR